jgi:hypothetical protein
MVVMMASSGTRFILVAQDMITLPFIITEQAPH